LPDLSASQESPATICLIGMLHWPDSPWVLSNKIWLAPLYKYQRELSLSMPKDTVRMPLPHLIHRFVPIVNVQLSHDNTNLYCQA
jgi:hypothetical protein